MDLSVGRGTNRALFRSDVFAFFDPTVDPLPPHVEPLDDFVAIVWHLRGRYAPVARMHGVLERDPAPEVLERSDVFEDRVRDEDDVGVGRAIDRGDDAVVTRGKDVLHLLRAHGRAVVALAAEVLDRAHPDPRREVLAFGEE